ncbi:MAG TPA: caspase family protein [Dermatophilaceae bacterium]|nr:caspase family protein [Dermatophilaceae bacterium]
MTPPATQPDATSTAAPSATPAATPAGAPAAAPAATPAAAPAAAPAADTPKRRLYALLVGIDDYPPPVPRLRGCVNDVTAFAETLRGRVHGDRALDAEILTDAAATRQAVIDAFRTHLGQAGPEDVALFYYSGHGSQQQTPQEFWGVEPDHVDETLVLVDSRLPDQWDLADKELATLISEVAAGGCHLLIVLDCCHSGDATRASENGVRDRLAPPDARARPGASYLTGIGAVRGAIGSRWSPAGGDHVLLAACRASERAKELAVLGEDRGAFSFALETALRESGGQPSYRDIHRWATAGVLRRVVDQHPQVEVLDAADLDRPFLGGAIPPTPRRLTLSMLPDGWSVDAGAVHGVPAPIGDDSTELAVYAADAATTGQPLAIATVTKVLPDRSLVSLSTELDDSRVYRAVVMTIPLRPMTIAVVGDAPGTQALRAAADQADPTLIDLVDDQRGAELLVEVSPEGFTIRRPGVARPIVPVVSGDAREERTIAALEHVSRWMRLSALRNPSTRLPEGAVAITVETDAGALDTDGRLNLSYAGDSPPAFTVTLANTMQETLWCALLDLTETYGIFTDAFPAGSIELAPGQSRSVAMTGQVSDDLWRAGTIRLTDQLKAIVSTLEFDPRSLEQDELDVTMPSAKGPILRGGAVPHSTLDRLLTRVTTRRLAPPGELERVADWRTDDLYVVTHRPMD